MLAAAGGKNRILPPIFRAFSVDTPQLANELERWKWQDGRRRQLLIGGPEGLSPACSSSGNRAVVSALTPLHPLVRVPVAESLYRAGSITTNPYHRVIEVLRRLSSGMKRQNFS